MVYERWFSWRNPPPHLSTFERLRWFVSPFYRWRVRREIDEIVTSLAVIPCRATGQEATEP